MLIEEHDQANLFISRLLEDKAALGRGEQTKMKRGTREQEKRMFFTRLRKSTLQLAT
jgi:hypothetical protein